LLREPRAKVVCSAKGDRVKNLSDIGQLFPDHVPTQSSDTDGFGDDDDLGNIDLDALMGDLDGEELDLGEVTWVGEEDGEELEDEEIFNLDSGWSVDAFDAGSSSLGLDLDKLEDEDEDDDQKLGMAAQQILRSIPLHRIRELEVSQKEADELNEERRKGRHGGTKAKTKRRLRIIGGAASGIRIHSQVGDLTRPMMEKVRGAMFDAFISRLGGRGLPAEGRWLDLFAGTGSVGIEGLSRGCKEGHFIELDPWVVSNVLQPNLELTRMASRAAVHQMKAEDFLRKGHSTPRFAGGAFDFVSVCPPYLLVSYPELFGLLEGSPLIHDETHIVVEYPKELKHEIPDRIGDLIKFRDRRYGRTYLAMYGPE